MPRGTRSPSRFIAAAALAALPAAAGAQSFTFNNPLAGGADPWVQLYNGTYYYTDTTGGDLMIASGSTIPGVLTASMTDVLHMPSGFANVWAPELHYSPADNRWYAYFAATTPTLDHREYVAQSNTSNPLSGGWTFLGQMTDPTNKWAIDGTTLTTGGKTYSIWSGWPGDVNGQQNLYVAPMSDLHTVSGSRTLISSPTNAWEQVGSSGTSLPTINEGPEVLVSPATAAHPNGVTTLIYSASGSFTDAYCLGMLTLTGTDPTNPASWTKDNAAPVFQSGNGVYGPGHASFTTSDNGTRNWIVYHANVQSLASGGAVFNRNVRTQPFFFNPDGTPSFGQPVPVTVPIQYGPVSWVAGINGSPVDSAHQYDAPANWVNNAVTDSFANVTLTDNTTLYFAGDRTLAGRWAFTYGSGQKFLSFQSTDANAHTVTLNGGVDMATLGGANNLFLSVGVRPLTLALGATTPTFNLSAGNSFYADGNVTGSVGLTVSNAGTLVFRNGGKTYTGTTTVSAGTLAAGDGSATGVASGNLAPTSVVSVASGATLQLAGLSGSAEVETVAGLTGAGTVTGANPAGSTLTLAVPNGSAYAFTGTLTGTPLSVAKTGGGSQVLAAGFTVGGAVTTSAGTLELTGTSNVADLFARGGTTLIDAGGTVTTTSFASAGLNAGDGGTIAVGGATAGTLYVNNSFNVGDNGTGVLTVGPNALVRVQYLYVAKFGAAAGTVNQTGGTVSGLSGGGDWRVGGGVGAADAAAVGAYNLSAGTFTTGSYNLQVGAYGTGTFAQTGGAATVGGYLSVGRFPGSAGTLDLSAGTGTFSARSQTLAIVGEQGTGTLLVGGASVFNAKTLAVSLNGGTGTVTQTGGVVNASAGVTLATAAGTATYTLAGGRLLTVAVSQGAGTAAFHFNGGTLAATAAAPTLMQGVGTADVGTGGATVDTAAFTATIAQPLTHAASLGAAPDGGLTKLGTGLLTLSGANTYTGPTTVNAGRLAFAAGSTATVRTLGTLAVNAGSAVVNAPASSATRTLLVTTGLTANTAGGSYLDLTGNDLVVRNTPAATVAALLAAGYANGTWAGPGLTSSAAAANVPHLTALGYAQDDDGTGQVLYGAGASLGTFDAYAPTAADTLVRYTDYGDADLDGRVTGADYTRIDVGYAARLTGWYNGDFNYDGAVDGSDYTLIDNAFDLQSADGFALPSAVAVPTAEVAAVPEPASLAGLALLAGIAGRRHRRAATISR